MSKEYKDGYSAGHKKGYQTAEKLYAAQIAAMQADIDHLNRSKGAARSLIKRLKSKAGE